ncbi:MAG: dethiobiotin synthase [Methylohalobius sp.]
MPEVSGLFITGTDTGVGKTFIGAALVRALKRSGLKVWVRKPVETGCVRTPSGLLPQDAQLLNRAAGDLEPLKTVCPYRFEAAVSPERAARLCGQALELELLVEACRPPGKGVMLVEGAGGFYSPIAAASLNADLAQALAFPVLVVAADRLGVIHQVLTTLEAVASRGLDSVGVVLNQIRRSDAPTMDNFEDLQRFSQAPIYPVPFLPPGDEIVLEQALRPLIERLKSLWLATPEQ